MQGTCTVAAVALSESDKLSESDVTKDQGSSVETGAGLVPVIAQSATTSLVQNLGRRITSELQRMSRHSSGSSVEQQAISASAVPHWPLTNEAQIAFVENSRSPWAAAWLSPRNPCLDVDQAEHIPSISDSDLQALANLPAPSELPDSQRFRKLLPRPIEVKPQMTAQGKSTPSYPSQLVPRSISKPVAHELPTSIATRPPGSGSQSSREETMKEALEAQKLLSHLRTTHSSAEEELARLQSFLKKTGAAKESIEALAPPSDVYLNQVRKSLGQADQQSFADRVCREPKVDRSKNCQAHLQQPPKLTSPTEPGTRSSFSGGVDKEGPCSAPNSVSRIAGELRGQREVGIRSSFAGGVAQEEPSIVPTIVPRKAGELRSQAGWSCSTTISQAPAQLSTRLPLGHSPFASTGHDSIDDRTIDSMRVYLQRHGLERRLEEVIQLAFKESPNSSAESLATKLLSDCSTHIGSSSQSISSHLLSSSAGSYLSVLSSKNGRSPTIEDCLLAMQALLRERPDHPFEFLAARLLHRSSDTAVTAASSHAAPEVVSRHGASQAGGDSVKDDDVSANAFQMYGQGRSTGSIAPSEPQLWLRRDSNCSTPSIGYNAREPVIGNSLIPLELPSVPADASMSQYQPPTKSKRQRSSRPSFSKKRSSHSSGMPHAKQRFQQGSHMQSEWSSDSRESSSWSAAPRKSDSGRHRISIDDRPPSDWPSTNSCHERLSLESDLAEWSAAPNNAMCKWPDADTGTSKCSAAPEGTMCIAGKSDSGNPRSSAGSFPDSLIVAPRNSMCTVANTGLENPRCSVDNNSSRVSVAPKNSMCAVANTGPEKSRCSIDSNSTSWSVASKSEAGNATKADPGHLANSVDVAGSSECKWPEPFWSTDEESDARITLHASEDAGPKLETKQNAGGQVKDSDWPAPFWTEEDTAGSLTVSALETTPKALWSTPDQLDVSGVPAPFWSEDKPRDLADAPEPFWSLSGTLEAPLSPQENGPLDRHADQVQALAYESQPELARTANSATVSVQTKGTQTCAIETTVVRKSSPQADQDFSLSSILRPEHRKWVPPPAEESSLSDDSPEPEPPWSPPEEVASGTSGNRCRNSEMNAGVTFQSWKHEHVSSGGESPSSSSSPRQLSKQCRQSTSKMPRQSSSAAAPEMLPQVGNSSPGVTVAQPSYQRSSPAMSSTAMLPRKLVRSTTLPCSSQQFIQGADSVKVADMRPGLKQQPPISAVTPNARQSPAASDTAMQSTRQETCTSSPPSQEGSEDASSAAAAVPLSHQERYMSAPLTQLYGNIGPQLSPEAPVPPSQLWESPGKDDLEPAWSPPEISCGSLSTHAELRNSAAISASPHAPQVSRELPKANRLQSQSTEKNSFKASASHSMPGCRHHPQQSSSSKVNSPKQSMTKGIAGTLHNCEGGRLQHDGSTGGTVKADVSDTVDNCNDPMTPPIRTTPIDGQHAFGSLLAAAIDVAGECSVEHSGQSGVHRQTRSEPTSTRQRVQRNTFSPSGSAQPSSNEYAVEHMDGTSCQSRLCGAVNAQPQGVQQCDELMDSPPRRKHSESRSTAKAQAPSNQHIVDPMDDVSCQSQLYDAVNAEPEGFEQCDEFMDSPPRQSRIHCRTRANPTSTRQSAESNAFSYSESQSTARAHPPSNEYDFEHMEFASYHSRPCGAVNAEPEDYEQGYEHMDGPPSQSRAHHTRACPTSTRQSTPSNVLGHTGSPNTEYWRRNQWSEEVFAKSGANRRHHTISSEMPKPRTQSRPRIARSSSRLSNGRDAVPQRERAKSDRGIRRRSSPHVISSRQQSLQTASLLQKRRSLDKGLDENKLNSMARQSNNCSLVQDIVPPRNQGEEVSADAAIRSSFDQDGLHACTLASGDILSRKKKVQPNLDSGIPDAYCWELPDRRRSQIVDQSTRKRLEALKWTCQQRYKTLLRQHGLEQITTNGDHDLHPDAHEAMDRSKHQQNHQREDPIASSGSPGLRVVGDEDQGMLVLGVVGSESVKLPGDSLTSLPDCNESEASADDCNIIPGEKSSTAVNRFGTKMVNGGRKKSARPRPSKMYWDSEAHDGDEEDPAAHSHFYDVVDHGVTCEADHDFKELEGKQSSRLVQLEPLYKEGDEVEYWSQSHRCYTRSRVKAVDRNTAEIMLECKDGVWLAQAQQISLMRPAPIANEKRTTLLSNDDRLSSLALSLSPNAPLDLTLVRDMTASQGIGLTSPDDDVNAQASILEKALEMTTETLNTTTTTLSPGSMEVSAAQDLTTRESDDVQAVIPGTRAECIKALFEALDTEHVGALHCSQMFSFAQALREEELDEEDFEEEYKELCEEYSDVDPEDGLDFEVFEYEVEDHEGERGEFYLDDDKLKSVLLAVTNGRSKRFSSPNKPDTKVNNDLPKEQGEEADSSSLGAEEGEESDDEHDPDEVVESNEEDVPPQGKVAVTLTPPQGKKSDGLPKSAPRPPVVHAGQERSQANEEDQSDEEEEEESEEEEEEEEEESEEEEED